MPADEEGPIAAAAAVGPFAQSQGTVARVLHESERAHKRDGGGQEQPAEDDDDDRMPEAAGGAGEANSEKTE